MYLVGEEQRGSVYVLKLVNLATRPKVIDGSVRHFGKRAAMNFICAAIFEKNLGR